MGSVVHIVVVGGGRDDLRTHAQRRFEDLEARWSRFRTNSEISRLNRSAGAFVPVSGETAGLVGRAVEGWRRTGGLFDPTLLGAVIRAGYDRPLDQLRALSRASTTESGVDRGCAGIAVARGAVRLPAGVGFDPGGVGKGYAADIVCAELLQLGARGALVNAGGDVRVTGEGPEGGGWTVAVSHPHRERPLAMLGLADGAVATSTTLVRRWQQADGQVGHHLIDPETGRPSTEGAELASVVASEGWLAEVWAKVLLLDPRQGVESLDREGLSGLVVHPGGRVEITSGLGVFLCDGGRPRLAASRTG